MKRNFLKVLICVLLVATMVMAPVSAMAKTVQIMKVNVDGARLRSGPGAYAELKPSLKLGTKVFYAGKKSAAFYYVCTAGGRKGWVYKNFLSAYGACQSKQVARANKTAPVYNKNSTKYGIKGYMKAGQFVIVYEAHGGWAYVKNLSGKGGFVKTSTLSKP